MWGKVSEFTTVMGRQAFVVTPKDIPEDAVEFMVQDYFDIASGLLIRAEVANFYMWTSDNETATAELHMTSVLSSQTVLDTLFPVIDHPPDLTFEKGTPGQSRRYLFY